MKNSCNPHGFLQYLPSNCRLCLSGDLYFRNIPESQTLFAHVYHINNFTQLQIFLVILPFANGFQAYLSGLGVLTLLNNSI